MLSVLLDILTVALVFVSIFLGVIVLMQKSKSDAGMGAAMGGGFAESTFGADTGNVLSKGTINASIIFFILSLTLYLGRLYEHKHGSSGASLPSIAGPALPPISLPPSSAPASTPAQKAPAPATPSQPAPTAPAAPSGGKP